MAYFNSTTTLVLLLILSLHLLISTPTISARRNLAIIEGEEEDPPLKPPPKKKTIQETKNHTNLTKAIKPKKSNSTTTLTPTPTTKIKIGKLNKTLNATPKSSNSTKLPKLIKPLKSNSTKIHLKSLNSTSKPLKPVKKSQDLPLSTKKKIQDLSLSSKKKNTTTITKSTTTTKSSSNAQPISTNKKKTKPSELVSWLDQETYSDVDSDFIAEFRGLPSRILPDLERLSITSRAYISLANKGITEGVKPYVGHRYAPTIASAASAAILVLPLLLLTLLLHQLRSYLSLPRLLVFIQAYLAIYFATLAVTALATGLEPLRFFYAASPASYACTQAMQTMGYVMYLLAQAVHLVVAFSSSAADGSGGGERGLALAQMVVGLAVGMHYYVVVFHRAVAGEPPRANWRVHAVYAAGFLVICACARAERRKKAYLPLDGSDDGKKS